MPNNNPAKLASLRKLDYKGSWWKDYYKTRTTMSFGNFTPVHIQEIPAKTLFKIKPQIRFESLPMLSPLYDGFTMRTKFYGYPIRLAIPELFKNRQQPWGSIPNFEFPQLIVQHDYTIQSLPQKQSYGLYSLAGSLLDMLGMSYGFVNANQSFNNPAIVRDEYSGTSFVNLLPLIAYIDCWLRGEYNPQDELIPVLNENIYEVNGELKRIGFYTYLKYDALSTFVDLFRGFSNNTGYDYSVGGLAVVNNEKLGGALDLFLDTSYSGDSFDFSIVREYPLFTIGGVKTQWDEELDYGSMSVFSAFDWGALRNTTSNVGFLPVTYKGDYLSSWFSAEGVSRLEDFVVNQGDSFLSLRQKNADFLVEALGIISGNRPTDYLQFIFDTYLELKDHPILLGWDEIHFGANEDTTATANTGNGDNGILGAVSSKARDFNNRVKPISVKTKEPMLLMVCSSIIPNVVYYQGVDRFMLKTTYSDLWHPQYDSRGFQRINVEEYYNPYCMGRSNDDGAGSDVYPFQHFSDDNYIPPFVPLGWEYMSRISTVKGGMKTSRFRTWSNIRDFGQLGVNTDWSPDVTDFEQLTTINPLDGTLFVGGDVVSPGDVSALADWFVALPSTYVRGIPYNMPFANVDAFDNQNFVVNYGFVVSQYQPITHTLINKTI